MSWDIYGNHLRRGHCEVHPHVHEEYPCSICMAERNRPQINRHAHEEFERLQYELDQQGDYIRHLESERAALAAQVQALGDKLSEVVALLDVDGMTAVQWLLDNCPEIESLTDMEPQQHLAELRAEAIEQAVNETKKLESTPCGQWWYCLADDLKKCAEQIRREGK